jgi:hypothetical protein
MPILHCRILACIPDVVVSDDAVLDLQCTSDGTATLGISTLIPCLYLCTEMGWISRSHSAESGPSAWHASPTGSPLKGVAAQTAPAEPASKNNLQEVLPRSHETVLPPRPARGM